MKLPSTTTWHAILCRSCAASTGVGRVQLFGAEQAMRIWVDPAKLAAYGLTIGEVAQAIEQQNIQIAPGRLGDEPAQPGQRLTVPSRFKGS